MLAGHEATYRDVRCVGVATCAKRALNLCIYPAIGVLPDLQGARDLGKQLSSQMRYVPTVLAALEESDAAPSAGGAAAEAGRPGYGESGTSAT